MSPSINDAIEALRVFYLDGGSLVLLFDYDGTLTPIVARPELARLAPRVRKLLLRLLAAARVHVGVISGRTLDDLKSLVDLPGLCLAGAAGMEFELGGERILHPAAGEIAAAVAELIRRLEPIVAEFPNAWIDDKRFACTVHYRGVAAERIAALRSRVCEAAGLAGDGMRIVEGPMALELVHAVGWHKGDAVRKIIEYLEEPRAMVVYAGDGGNDIDAYDAVFEVAGLTIGVGADAPPPARFHLPDPAAFHAFLDSLSTSLY